MVQVHVTPQLISCTSSHLLAGVTRRVRHVRWRTRLAERLAKLPYTCGGRNLCPPARFRCHRAGGFLAVKKLIVLAVLGLGAFAVWRKVQSDRAELDLWTEATAADED